MNADEQGTDENYPQWQKLIGAVIVFAIFVGIAIFVGSEFSFGLGLGVIACVWDKPVLLVLGKRREITMRIHYLMILGYLITIAILIFETHLQSQYFEDGSSKHNFFFTLAPLVLLFYVYKEIKQIKKLNAASVNNVGE